MTHKRALTWIAGNDTGTSSKTIWSVMQGIVQGPHQLGGSFDLPHDPADFGRCFRLLQLVPEWRQGLHKISEVFPAWKPMVDAWPELEELYVKALAGPTGNAPELFKRMQALVDEGRKLDGWKRTGKYSWSRGE